MFSESITPTAPARKGPGSAGGSGGGSGNEITALLSDEAQRRYLNYALSVITARALPDVRDGMKPVQRRILFGTFHNLHLTHEAKYRKCAQVVGEIMGKYHPHGDSAIYDALVRLAQDFSLRYPLVDGHGNFGSLDGDSAAAMRYTECRLAALSSELLEELAQKTVDYRPNYDGTCFEPVVLPARLPQLLMNGAMGIAVGMATNIPPHNLGELVGALTLLIDKPDATLPELLKHIKGPDFPTDGLILNTKEELQAIYETGQGPIYLRGEWRREEMRRGSQVLVITSIPYAVNKAKLVEEIGKLVADRKLPPLIDVRDESTDVVRVVLELKKDADPDVVMAYLFKHTALQTNFNVNMTCLVPTENPEVCEPKRLGLKDMLQHFLDFRFEVVTRRLRCDLDELEKRLHLLEGFCRVYDALDEMLAIIRKSDGKADAAEKLIKRFKLSEEQVDAILEMKLYRLAKLEIRVIEKELSEKRKEQARLNALLASEGQRWGLVQDELAQLKKRYGDKRRTRIGGPVSEVTVSEDTFIADEDANVILTRDGWVKRLREIKDPSATRLREGDAVQAVLCGSLKSNVVFFTNFGAAYVTRVHDIPASTGYGDPVQKLFKFEDGEQVVAAFSLDPRLALPKTMLAVTEQGFGLRFSLKAHSEVSSRTGRLFAKKANENRILGVVPASERDLVTLVTEDTYSMTCRAEDINELSGPGKGVAVIKLSEGDRVIAFNCTSDRSSVIKVETSKGKEMDIPMGRLSARGAKGRQAFKREKFKKVEPTGFTWVQLPSPEAGGTS
ncbi:MAG: DNA topoisomerase IV subunit A [Myxococcales bacterium]|nr:DNA topoisomerase IV subunit A [Myxococcales bacterium]